LDYHIPCGSDVALFNSWRSRYRAGASGNVSIASVLPEFFAQVASQAAKPMPVLDAASPQFAR
jgi:hypothetical protein